MQNPFLNAYRHWHHQIYSWNIVLNNAACNKAGFFMWFQQHVTIAFYLNVLNIFIRTEGKKVSRQSSLLSQKLSSFIGYKANNPALYGCPNIRCSCCQFSVSRLGNNHVYAGIQQLAEISVWICPNIPTIFFFFSTNRRAVSPAVSPAVPAEIWLIIFSAAAFTAKSNFSYRNR